MTGTNRRDIAFVVTGWPLNAESDADRKVPLWTFFGRAFDPRIKRMEVQYPGLTSLADAVQANGTWLVVYQGMITEQHLEAEIVVVARDAAGAEVARQSIKVR